VRFTVFWCCSSHYGFGENAALLAALIDRDDLAPPPLIGAIRPKPFVLMF